jgi:hypothetical protein
MGVEIYPLLNSVPIKGDTKMYDILSNHKVELVRSGAIQNAGAGSAVPATPLNLFSGGLANRCLLIIDVSVVASGGSLVVAAQDSPDGTTYDEDFATSESITETGIYTMVIDDPNQYLKFVPTVSDAAVTWSAVLVTFEEQRRPVTQAGTDLTVTYGTGRKAKVATA